MHSVEKFPDQMASMTGFQSPIPPDCWDDIGREPPETTFDYVKFVFKVPVVFTLIPVGLVSNALAFVVLGREMKSSSTRFLLQFLAVADSSVLVSILLLDPFEDLYLFTGLFPEYLEYCKLPAEGALAGFSWTCKTIAVYGIVFVTVERYIAVCKPHMAKSLCTVGRAKKAVAGLCFLSVGFNSPKFFETYMEYRFDPCSQRIRGVQMERSYVGNYYYALLYDVAMSTAVTFVVPFSICFVLNIILIRSVTAAAKTDLNKTGGADRTESRTLVVRVVVIVSFFLIFEMPREIGSIYVIFDENVDKFNSIMDPLVILTSVVNFYLYFLTGRRFRKVFWKLFRCASDE